MRRARDTNDFPEVQEVLYPGYQDMNPSEEKKQKPTESLADYVSSSATNRYTNVMHMDFTSLYSAVPSIYVDIPELDFRSLYPSIFDIYKEQREKTELA